MARVIVGRRNRLQHRPPEVPPLPDEPFVPASEYVNGCESARGCGNEGIESHSCPFRSDIDHDETQCNCCTDCIEECAQDV